MDSTSKNSIISLPLEKRIPFIFDSHGENHLSDNEIEKSTAHLVLTNDPPLGYQIRVIKEDTVMVCDAVWILNVRIDYTQFISISDMSEKTRVYISFIIKEQGWKTLQPNQLISLSFLIELNPRKEIFIPFTVPTDNHGTYYYSQDFEGTLYDRMPSVFILAPGGIDFTK